MNLIVLTRYERKLGVNSLKRDERFVFEKVGRVLTLAMLRIRGHSDRFFRRVLFERPKNPGVDH
jgi:hypothetical protein